MWDPANHYPLCNSCNSFQAAKHEGGFGNRQTDSRVNAKPHVNPAAGDSSQSIYDKNIYFVPPEDKAKD